MADEMHSRPARRPETLWLCCRRHPVLATLVASLLLLSGFTGWLVAKE